MHHIHPHGKAAAAAILVLLVSVALAACGGSSTTTSSTASAASASDTTSTSGGAHGAFTKRFSALRECLKKEGITLPTPTRKAGQHTGGGGFFGGGTNGGAKLPNGESRTQLQEALKKCGGGTFPRGGYGGAGARLSNPKFKAALAKFVSCMRADGINLPEPNTSGKGPIFSTKGIDSSGTAFKTAESKCRSDLAGVFGARPGGAGGAPPAGGGGAGMPPAETAG